jgi:HAD superfamily hydrolase (TIGR01484 family)
MELFHRFPDSAKSSIRYVLTDIDDTLTFKGRLPAVVFAAMERLQQAGIRVVPITGRPAGWCDHIARMWPVDAVVGENGAFYFFYNEPAKKMVRRYWKTERERLRDRGRLERLKAEILAGVPGSGVSADQAYREADLAIDYCEDVPPLSRDRIDQIARLFEQAGACAKVSSIHVNGWFGDYDKLAMTRILFEEVFQSPLDKSRNQAIFAGDSPNDVPMFAFFPHSVGVANIRRFEGQLARNPAWVTTREGGYGFAEMVDVLLSGSGSSSAEPARLTERINF